VNVSNFLPLRLRLAEFRGFIMRGKGGKTMRTGCLLEKEEL